MWTSNTFAILSLRALYVMLAGLIRCFVCPSTGLCIILVLVGANFVVSDLIGKVPIWVSLPSIATVVTISIAASLYKTRGHAREPIPGEDHTDGGGPAKTKGPAA